MVQHPLDGFGKCLWIVWRNGKSATGLQNELRGLTFRSQNDGLSCCHHDERLRRSRSARNTSSAQRDHGNLCQRQERTKVLQRNGIEKGYIRQPQLPRIGSQARFVGTISNK